MATAEDWPKIWRCASCGSIVHPVDDQVGVASCARCGRVTQARLDGGGPAD
ncbi:MAG: hypothetical protein ACYCU7_00450 [Acidimicrobiales bacterium]